MFFTVFIENHYIFSFSLLIWSWFSEIDLSLDNFSRKLKLFVRFLNVESTFNAIFKLEVLNKIFFHDSFSHSNH